MEKTYEELTASEKEDLVSYWALDETTLGSELVDNGGFTGSSSGWSLGTGWGYGTNNIVATSATTGQYLNQTLALTIGKTYILNIDVTITGGALDFQLGGSGAGVSLSSGHNAKQYIPSSIGAIYFMPQSTFSGTIDNVSVKEIQVEDKQGSNNGSLM